MLNSLPEEVLKFWQFHAFEPPARNTHALYTTREDLRRQLQSKKGAAKTTNKISTSGHKTVA
jgi:hypothetical protein